MFLWILLGRTILTHERQELWLLYTDGRTPRRLAEADQIQGTFSPDGQWVAVSTLSGTQGQRTAQITIVNTASQERRELGEGFGSVWVQP